jgi:hypothetical protein
MPENGQQRECPLCGGTMEVRETGSVTRIPGNPDPTTRLRREWFCRDCDNFEDVEDD